MPDDRRAAPLVVMSGAARIFAEGSAGTAVLRPVLGEVEPGARIAIVGPSGSGKSTLLYLVAGLDLPTAGSVTWPALGARPQLRPCQIGFAFQMPSLIPSLSVMENVELPLILAGRGDAAAAAGEAIQTFGLGDIASNMAEDISGGQAMRVSLARAIAPQPRLLLADEPTGQLDHETASQVMGALFSWASRSGAALVVATHDIEIAGLFPRVWRINHGLLTDASPGAQS